MPWHPADGAFSQSKLFYDDNMSSPVLIHGIKRKFSEAPADLDSESNIVGGIDEDNKSQRKNTDCCTTPKAALV